MRFGFELSFSVQGLRLEVMTGLTSGDLGVKC